MQDKINNIERIAQSGKHIFTTADLGVLWSIPDRRRLIELIKYYLRTSRLTLLTKGVYAYGTDYDQLEIAQKLVPLSYISLYTACQVHGLTFQHYETIFAIAPISRTYNLPFGSFEYHRVKDSIFFNPHGLTQTQHYTIASPERTVADCLYLYPNFAFDNLRSLDHAKLASIASIYDNHSLTKRINLLIRSL